MTSPVGMKVALYIRSIKSAQGTERVTANIAMCLADSGHEVDFLVEDSEGWLIDRLAVYPRINVIDLRKRCTPTLLSRGFQLWIILKNTLTWPLALVGAGSPCTMRLVRLMAHNNPPVFALYRYIMDERPVSVMSFLNQQNLVLLLVAPFCSSDTRIIVNVRNHIAASAKHGKSRWMRSVPHLMRRYFPRADTIVAPSKGVIEDVKAITRITAGTYKVIYNPVYRPEIIELAREAPSHDWMKNKSIPIIIAAGKLKPQKDFGTLLRAFSIVHAQRKVRLIILGRGPQQQDLMVLARELGVQDDFDMPGHVNNPYAFLGSAAVFVLSSAWEGLPNVLIEALACGCPVVSTDCPSGPSEILDAGRVGRLVPVGDHQKMADAIIETLDNPLKPEVMINQAMRFSYERSIKEYESLLGLKGQG